MITKASIFIDFIRFVEIRNVKYALLGNTGSYPNKIESDIDIAVSQETYSNINNYINEFCRLNGYYICNCLQHEITAKYFVIAALDELEGRIEFLALDVCSNYYRDARLLIPWQDLLNNTKPYTSICGSIQFNVCEYKTAFLYYFIKR